MEKKLIEKMFEDEALQCVYEKSSVKMQERMNILDRISRDIKALEVVLKMALSQSEVEIPVERSRYSNLCVVIRWDGERIIASINGDEKPLIESKAWVRWEASPYLPELLYRCHIEVSE